MRNDLPGSFYVAPLRPYRYPRWRRFVNLFRRKPKWVHVGYIEKESSD